MFATDQLFVFVMSAVSILNVAVFVVVVLLKDLIFLRVFYRKREMASAQIREEVEVVGECLYGFYIN